ncbi:MAG: condensation domain-containing protein, partial [Pyrinomonadaceae bacterium]
VRQLLVGGEALSAAHIRRALEALEGVEVTNGYGPTETTTFACTHRISEAEVSERGIERGGVERVGERGVERGGERGVERGVERGGGTGSGTVAIGRPIVGARVYVLDARGRVVVRGGEGELYIGGEGLARGYVGRAEQTAERFVPDAVSEKAGERLYRTGDLVRWSGEGELEYVGRMDDQVKVRGYRIELGEVEAALREQECVRDAVVVAVEDEGGGGKRLVAYVVVEAAMTAAGGGERERVGAQEIRRHVGERLPEYMVPSVVVMLDEMPLKENGKVDRGRLPAPEREWAREGERYAEPRTHTEELLAGIWEEVLRQEAIGIHANFFNLGGHSLLATQVMSRVREVFELDVPLRRLFESPTVAELGQTLDELRRQGGSTPPVVMPRGEAGPPPLSFAQQRLWFMDSLELSDTLHIVAEAMRLTGRLQVGALAQSVNEIVRRHEVLRTQIRKEHGEPVQVVLPRLMIESPVVDLSGVSSASEREGLCRRLCARAARRRLDLNRGPLLRLVVLRNSPDEHVLLLVMHHIVTDAWSRGVFYGELSRLYAAFESGLPSLLPELAVQYADYATWQRRWLQGEVLAEQLSFWKKRLAGVPPVLDLPTIDPPPGIPSYRSDSQPLILEEGRAGRLRALSRKEGATLFMTLLAVYQTLLHCYTGQDEICVASPVANRNRAETEPLIGFFVNLLVLNTDFGGDLTFRQVLRQVRETTLDADAHQDFPFEKVVEIFQQERGVKNPSLAQAAFSFHSRSSGTTDAAGLGRLSFAPIEVETQTVEHDLTLVIEDSPAGIGGALVYKRDLYSHATISRMLEHFQVILDLVLEQPDVRILDLPLRNRRSVTPPSDAAVALRDEAEDFDFSL